MKNLFAVLLCVLMATFGLAACGGSGGGGGGGGKAGFAADYKGAVFNYEDPGHFNSAFIGLNVPGTAVHNGTSGSVGYKEYKNSDGDTNSGTAQIDVDAHGFANITGTGGDPMWGGATPDGSVLFSVDPQPGIDNSVNMLVGVNLSSGMSNNKLSGIYNCAEINNSPTGTDVNAFTFISDGLGGFSVPEFSATGTYTVAADGSLTVTPDGSSSSFMGAVRHDGEMFVLSNTNGTDDLGMIVCVLDAGGHALAQAQGNYHMAKFSVPSASSPETDLIDLYLDGLGMGTVAEIANSTGFMNSPSLMPITYAVDGSGYYQVNGSEPVYVTPSGDFMLAIMDNTGGGDGEIVVGARYTPAGFPTEYLGVSIGGDAIANIEGSVFSMNAQGSSIAPGQSGTLGIRALIDTSGMYLSEADPFIVNSAGVITVNSSQKTGWGFVNTTAKTFLLATTDQTMDNFVNLIPGVMAGTGLDNTTATMDGVYNCAGMYDTVDPSIELQFTGDGQFTLGGIPYTYDLKDNGLLTIFLSGNWAGSGMVQADRNMLTATDGSMVICLKQPASISFDSLAGTYMYGTFGTDTGSGTEVGAEIGTVAITNTTGNLEVTPTALYNSTGEVNPLIPESSQQLFVNTTTNTFELGGAGGAPVWVSQDYNMFVIGIAGGTNNQIIFGIRK